MAFVADLTSTPWPTHVRIALVEVTVMAGILVIAWYINPRAGLYMSLGVACVGICVILLVLVWNVCTGKLHLGWLLDTCCNLWWSLVGHFLDLLMLPLRLAHCVHTAFMKHASDSTLKAPEMNTGCEEWRGSASKDVPQIGGAGQSPNALTHEARTTDSAASRTRKGMRDFTIANLNIQVGMVREKLLSVQQKVHQQLFKQECNPSILRISSQQAVGLVEVPAADIESPRAPVEMPKKQHGTSSVKEKCIFSEGFKKSIDLQVPLPDDSATFSDVFLYPHIKLMLNMPGNSCHDQDPRPSQFPDVDSGRMYPHLKCSLPHCPEHCEDAETSFRSCSGFLGSAKVKNDSEAAEDVSTRSCSQLSTDSRCAGDV